MESLTYAESRFSSFRETDSLFVQDFLSGNQRGFDNLFSRYQPLLLCFINKMLGDSGRSEDLVQEVFLRVFKHLHRFDPSRKFSTWIYTIAVNLARNELRNRSRDPIILFQALQYKLGNEKLVLEFSDERFSPERMTQQRYLQGVIMLVLSKLPAHHREVFRLREIEGKPYEEIAEIAGVNIGTIKSRLNRARKAFAQIVAPMIQ